MFPSLLNIKMDYTNDRNGVLVSYTEPPPMLMSLNNTNIKIDGARIRYGSCYEEMLKFSKRDKIALKRFKLKLAHRDRTITQDWFFSLKKTIKIEHFSLCFTDYNNDWRIMSCSTEQSFHKFEYPFEDDIYIFEANDDELVFQESRSGYDYSMIRYLNLYGIVTGLRKDHIPILLKPDSIFELEWVIQKATSR